MEINRLNLSFQGEGKRTYIHDPHFCATKIDFLSCNKAKGSGMLRHKLWLNPARWQSKARSARCGAQLKHAPAVAGKPGGRSLGSRAFPLRPISLSVFKQPPTREICQLKAAGRKLHIQKQEPSPQTQQTEQFKTKVCGCKSNFPQPITIFSTLLNSLLRISPKIHPRLLDHLQSDKPRLMSPPCASRHGSFSFAGNYVNGGLRASPATLTF